jgi:predicted transcriptional regulator
MAQSLLEMAKKLVVAQMETYPLSAGEVMRLLERTHANLMLLRRREETRGVGREAPREPVDWRRSITRQTVTCLECGAVFKQLSVRHLRGHGLDGRSYRVKYGIPQGQALAARDVTARRRRIAQRVRMWEKAPRFIQAHERDGKGG